MPPNSVFPGIVIAMFFGYHGHPHSHAPHAELDANVDGNIALTALPRCHPPE